MAQDGGLGVEDEIPLVELHRGSRLLFQAFSTEALARSDHHAAPGMFKVLNIIEI